MLRRYATFVSFFRVVFDAFIVVCVWVLSYHVRYNLGIFSAAKGVSGFDKHLILTFPVVLICLLCYFFTGLYKPKRTQNILFHLVEIFKASVFSWLFLLTFLYYAQDEPYSRKLLFLMAIMLFIGLLLSHFFSLAVMRFLRSRGYNLRYYAVIGTGLRSQQLVGDIEGMKMIGLRCAFFIDDLHGSADRELMGFPVFGPIEKLPELVKAKSIDEVYLTLGGAEAQKAYPVLKAVQSLGVTVRIIPDWGDLASISDARITSIGSQVLFSAGDSPLDGFNMILKDVFDSVVALLLLVVFAIPMVIIAILIKRTSKGAVFYKQKRIGFGRQEFEIIKFRTMLPEAESDGIPKLASGNDSRRTAVGIWLRRFSLDELPQFMNVLKGQMSLVGPRPERPFFIKQFSTEYQDYMFRHKVKAGMTGWAQVNGLRGDTSLKKRLLYDMYYVRNWSFMLDILILLRTPWHVLKGKNAS
ncbi:MAG: undecaprenyl-phosphate glucose phosphotransferase [Anaerohalosphaeraceae bacterium]|nr:undecaprenyl-phosphate glucose phosphotransferase [Anaerohalosphaeraceae bacterium]